MMFYDKSLSLIERIAFILYIAKYEIINAWYLQLRAGFRGIRGQTKRIFQFGDWKSETSSKP